MASVLVTGGAGFIGSHLVDALVQKGHTVTVIDSLEPQVHRARPSYLNPQARYEFRDLREEGLLSRALADVDVVFHLAAMVGVGQSMYQIDQYVEANTFGTAVLLQCLVDRPVDRLVVASSMSIYGEGLYRTPDGELVSGVERDLEHLSKQRWEPEDAAGQPLTPVATPESKVPALPSVYALTKYDQERLCLTVGRAYRIPTVALRFFNIYGTRQALSNPYTGVLAIFASRVLNGKPPLIHEDGRQSRDFVCVRDVATACRLAMDADRVSGHAINIGSGTRHSIIEIADRICSALGRQDLRAEITGRYRMGDIRHCFADITAARELLGYEPAVGLDDGLAELAEWLRDQRPADRVDEAAAELSARGLTM